MLKGKNAVITGCLKGIGKATLELFAKNGATIWACCQYPEASFEEFVAELRQRYNVKIMPVFFDLSNEGQIKEAVKVIMADKLPVDILVNMAGMTQDALFHMISMEQMRKVFEINFFSQILFTQYITKLMLRKKSGSVINISSISGIDGNSGQLSYSSSKAALIGATKTLSAELAPLGIRVNAVAPGVIKTEMTDKMPAEMMQWFISRSNLKRIGQPTEVSAVILFLASDLSAYITGQVFRVDGGMN